jgi:hypothetical protein
MHAEIVLKLFCCRLLAALKGRSASLAAAKSKIHPSGRIIVSPGLHFRRDAANTPQLHNIVTKAFPNIVTGKRERINLS